MLIMTLALLVSGCANDLAFQEARALIESGELEQGLSRLQQAVAEDPSNESYQRYYQRQREIAVQRWLGIAERARGSGWMNAAEKAYLRVLRIDPENPRARSGIEAARKGRSYLA